MFSTHVTSSYSNLSTKLSCNLSDLMFPPETKKCVHVDALNLSPPCVSKYPNVLLSCYSVSIVSPLVSILSFVQPRCYLVLQYVTRHSAQEIPPCEICSCLGSTRVPYSTCISHTPGGGVPGFVALQARGCQYRAKRLQERSRRDVSNADIFRTDTNSNCCGDIELAKIV